MRTGPAGRAAGRAAGRPAGTPAGSAAVAAGGTSSGSGTGVDGSAPSGDASSAPLDSAQDAPAEAAAAPTRRRRPGRRPSWALFGVVATLALIGLLASVVLLFGRPSDGQLRSSAIEAAERYTATLTTYDARTLDEDVQRVRRVSTEEFAADYDETIEELREQIQTGQTISTGSVLGAGVEALEGDTARVLVAVNQEIRTSGQEPRTEANRIRMTLRRTGGNWLIGAVERL